MVMLDAVRSPSMSAYRNKICQLHAQFGPQCWALLYQTDVRCRSEFMDRIRYRLLARHNAAMQATPARPSTFDTTRPWDSVWMEATADHDFWQEEFRHWATLIRTNTVPIKDTLGTDATIAGHFNPQQSLPQAPPANQPGRAQPKAKATANKGPCKAFNNGTCHGATCSNGYGRHACNKCGATDHGALQCGKEGNGGKRNGAWNKRNNQRSKKHKN